LAKNGTSKKVRPALFKHQIYTNMAINTSLKEEVYYRLGDQAIDFDNMAPLLTNSFLHKTTHSAGHDLRSPLFVIRSYSHLLQKTQEKDRLQRGFKLMEEATYRMEQTINDFVGLIDIYTVPFPEQEMVSFESAYDAMRFELSDLIDTYEPTITCNFERLPQAYFNEKKLVEVMTYLVDNAIRHNSEEQDLRIVVSSQEVDGNVVLTVRDNGKGIESDKEKAKIKDPFYSYSDYEGCTGMGLAKVQAIAQASKNKFHIKSEKDKYTICHFVFA